LEYIDVIIITLALSLEFFAITFSSARLQKKNNTKSLILPPLILALFGSLFYFAGYWIGSLLDAFLQEYQYHITFFLLSALGIKMIMNGIGKKKGSLMMVIDNIKILTGVALAVSLNFLIAGITLLTLKGSLNMAVIIAFSIIFIVSIFGLFAGKALKNLSKTSLIAGGIILIFSAVKIFISYTGY
jgi:putative Mn2+ efflux pump MntP